MNKKNIAIFGGSFDPIHKGHIKIANHAIKELKLNKLVFVPVFWSPLKKNHKIVNADHRIKMINIVKPEKSEVSFFEINKQGKSYSIDTIKYFKTKYTEKDWNLFLLIGSDNLSKLRKWKNIDLISQLSQIIIYKRKKNINKINVKKYSAKILSNDLFLESSSEFKKGQLRHVDTQVLQYISDHFLYANDLANNILNYQRYKHSLATGHMAAEIAKSLNYNAKNAWFAGLMHDITKNWSEEKHRQFLRFNDINEENIPTHKLHQLTGSLWLKHTYLLNNEEIIKAISVHTTLDKDLDILDKIVFVADKICQGRNFSGIQKLRKLVFEDFELVFKKIVAINYQFVSSKTSVSKDQKHIYDKIIGN